MALQPKEEKNLVENPDLISDPFADNPEDKGSEEAAPLKVAPQKAVAPKAKAKKKKKSWQDVWDFSSETMTVRIDGDLAAKARKKAGSDDPKDIANVIGFALLQLEGEFFKTTAQESLEIELELSKGIFNGLRHVAEECSNGQIVVTPDAIMNAALRKALASKPRKKAK